MLEDALESTFNEAGFATLGVVFTGEGLRECAYYAKSDDEFMSPLNYGL
jgi:hypothetical protein